MDKVHVEVFQKKKDGTHDCGDSYFYVEKERMFICAVADGLGSGEFAKESSEIVMNVIRNNLDVPERQLFKKCNQELIGKRGVVVGILHLDFRSEYFTFTSIGNIGLIIVTDDQKKKRNIPNRGYLAGYERPFGLMKGKLTKQTNFFLYSDGVEEAELSQEYFLCHDIKKIVKTFEAKNNKPRADDTTLVALRYK